MIRAGSKDSARDFIPTVPSIFSVKSGKDGLDPSSLDHEVKDHPKVLEALRRGEAYVWCAIWPAGNDEREALRSRGQTLAEELNLTDGQIRFLFRDQLTRWVNLHPGLLPTHLGIRVEGWTLEEWQKLFRRLSNPWVNFGGRSEVAAGVEQGLTGVGLPNVLRLAGLSGIGKTRTSLEACRGSDALSAVLYFESPDSFTNELEQRIIRNQQICITAVIDDVSLEEWGRLIQRFSPFPERVRILTLGPEARGSYQNAEGILRLQSPGETAIASVLRGADPSLSEERSGELAHWSGEDLRLALLLLEAEQADPGLRNQPITSVREVWDRVIQLFSKEIPNADTFRNCFELLALFIDVGNRDETRDELSFIARFFDSSQVALDSAIGQAIRCGLGRQGGDFFEAEPRALARMAFEEWGWELVKNRLVEFVSSIPNERMKRRFFERSQECAQPIRAEVGAALDAWFREAYPAGDLSRIASRDTSRVFAAFTELSPEIGLPWLRDAITGASAETLSEFDGQPDGSGGWRGRRQIVWLCEGLACFPEFFWSCEEILHRLAMTENEPQISNNSTGEWRGLFLPLLSGTAVPFEDRFKRLLLRLEGGSRSVELATGAAAAILSGHFSRPSPPKVVGGRLVPPEWRPGTWGDLSALQLDVARRFLEAASTLPLESAEAARGAVLDELGRFLQFDCVDQLRQLFLGAIDGEDIRDLRAKVDDFLRWTDRVDESAKPAHLPNLLDWRRELQPTALSERIRDATSRPYWSFLEDEQRDAEAIYYDLAREILEHPDVLDDLAAWFDQEPKSADTLGAAAGRLDVDGNLVEWVAQRIRQGSSNGFVAGFLSKNTWRAHSSDPVGLALDSIVESHPNAACALSVRADQTERGFDRVRAAIQRGAGLHCLAGFMSKEWDGLLTDERQAEILGWMLPALSSGDQLAHRLAFQMMGVWVYSRPVVGPETASALKELLRAALESNGTVDAFHWKLCADLIPNEAGFKADVFADALTRRQPMRFDLEERAREGLTALASTDPDQVMEALGARMLEEGRSYLFFVAVFRDLFEAIGLDAVRGWVARSGVEGARRIARHVESPSPTPGDPLHVPPLTLWLLTEFESDDRTFREFCAGRHSLDVIVGSPDHPAEVEDRVKAYLEHPARRIREWAQYEIEHARHQATQWEDEEENFERT